LATNEAESWQEGLSRLCVALDTLKIARDDLKDVHPEHSIEILEINSEEEPNLGLSL